MELYIYGSRYGYSYWELFGRALILRINYFTTDLINLLPIHSINNVLLEARHQNLSDIIGYLLGVFHDPPHHFLASESDNVLFELVNFLLISEPQSLILIFNKLRQIIDLQETI